MLERLNILESFQFHKGTIKTSEAAERFRYPPHFNSIKVRLKHIYCRRGRWSNKFQFHKGTIKTMKAFKDVCRTFEFQFHKGTIKTGISAAGQSIQRFQFHKGTIKTDLPVER